MTTNAKGRLEFVDEIAIYHVPMKCQHCGRTVLVLCLYTQNGGIERPTFVVCRECFDGKRMLRRYGKRMSRR